MSSIQETHWFSFGECSVEIDEKVPTASISRGTLFFLHGRFGNGACWRPLLDRLSHDFRCIVIHFPGCAGLTRSAAVVHRPLSLFDTVELVMQAIRRFASSDSKVILVGHDYGGLVAQLCGIQVETKVAGLVLINSSHLMGGSRLKTRCWGMGLRRRFRRLLRHSSLKKSEKKSEKSENFQNLLNEQWLHHGDRVSLIQVIREIEHSWPNVYERRYWMDELRRKCSPALLLWGGLDELNSPEEGIQLWKALPVADYFEDNTGHWPQLEDPEWVATKIREFAFHLGLKDQPNLVRRSLLQ